MSNPFKTTKPEIGSGPTAPGASQDPFKAQQPLDIGLPTGGITFDPTTGQVRVSREPEAFTIESPESIITFDPAQNRYVISEPDAQRQLRESRLSARQGILDNLLTFGPERVAQLEQFEQTFFDELVNLTVDPAERQEIQAGRAGSPLLERVSRLRTQAGTQAILAKEDLAARDIQTRLQTLGLLEQGAGAATSADLARAGLGFGAAGLGLQGEQLALGGAEIGQQDILNQRALGEARRNTLLQAELERSKILESGRQANLSAGTSALQTGGEVVAAITTAAVLKAMTATCLHEDTFITVDDVQVPIRYLKVGDLIDTIHAGRRQLRPIKERSEAILSLYPMPVLILEFADGTHLIASAKHRLGSGRLITSVWPGESVDTKRVVSVRTSMAEVCRMRDILPDSDTGLYLANGVWVESMLKLAEVPHA